MDKQELLTYLEQILKLETKKATLEQEYKNNSRNTKEIIDEYHKIRDALMELYNANVLPSADRTLHCVSFLYEGLSNTDKSFQELLIEFQIKLTIDRINEKLNKTYFK